MLVLISELRSELGNAAAELVRPDDCGRGFAVRADGSAPGRRVVIEPLLPEPGGRVRDELRLAVVGGGKELRAFQEELGRVCLERPQEGAEGGAAMERTSLWITSRDAIFVS